MGPRFGGRGRERMAKLAGSESRCFNGAALWGARKGRPLILRRGRLARLQWGRALGGAEGAAAGRSRRSRRGPLQWGRALGGAEGVGVDSEIAAAKGASMGPRFGGRGRAGVLRAWHPCYRCFNGAALWGARKGIREQAMSNLPHRASMGPRFGGRGRGGALGWASGGTAGLQWGRALGGAEGRAARPEPLAEVGASMGPRFGGRGRARGNTTARTVAFASMGPRFGGRGRDRSWTCRRRAKASLQWGRALGGAEGAAKPPTAIATIRFNGAALWGARKGATPRPAPVRPPSCFNGAALWGARKGW